MLSKFRLRWLVLPLALLCSAHSWADSVTLITGEKITGTIKNQTDSEVTIDVPVSASITDERIIRKEDIAKIDKEQPDQIAYEQLIQIQPSSTLSYSSQTYGQILAALDNFEATYPKSSYLDDIKKLADSFQDEKQRVDAGQIKYLGQWLSKDEAARRSIQIVAMQVYGTMQRQAAAGDLVGAMQTFSTIERDYGNTRSYPAAVTLAQQVVARLQQDLVVRMQAVVADQDQLKKTIAFTAEPEKSQIIADAKAEQDRAAGAIAAAVASGSKWVPLIPRSLVSIETLQKVATAEAPRLTAIPVATMNLSIAKVDEARADIAGGDLSSAKSLLQEAATLWSKNEAAYYWNDRLNEKLAKMATPTPKPLVKPSPRPLMRPTPQMVNIILPPTPAPAETPFYMTLSGALPLAAGVLVIGGVIAMIGQKRARRQREAVE